MSPDISVLLPYRDAAATLVEALSSVLAQEGPSLEVVAVNDGSGDGSAALVAAVAATDPRVRPIDGPGEGLARALNRAASQATAPLLARMDADDVALPGRFATQLAELGREPRVAVLGTRVRAFPDSAVQGGLRRYVEWQNSLVTPEAHRADLFVESPLCHPSVLMRREAFEQVGGYRAGPFAEDYDLWLRLDAAGWLLAKVPSALLAWRHTPGRATFSDPRCHPERFRELKAAHLAPRLLRGGRPFVIWGAGPTGRRLARALEAHRLRPAWFVDVDPKKIGRQARGLPIRDPASLRPGEVHVLAAVGALGARALIRAHLDKMGFGEGPDYVCAA